jgi:hypothetical protein
MSGKFIEGHFEQACFDGLEALDYGIFHRPDILADGDALERAAYEFLL